MEIKESGDNTMGLSQLRRGLMLKLLLTVMVISSSILIPYSASAQDFSSYDADFCDLVQNSKSFGNPPLIVDEFKLVCNGIDICKQVIWTSSRIDGKSCLRSNSCEDFTDSGSEVDNVRTCSITEIIDLMNSAL